MYHNKCSVVAKQTFHTLIICVASVCAMSCGGHKSGDARTEYEQAQFIRTNDSILRLDSLSLRLCDSIMAATDDSLTYYDYYILKGRYYLLSATPDSALHYARRTRDFMEKQPSTSRTRGIKAIANSTEASFYHLLRPQPSGSHKAEHTGLSANNRQRPEILCPRDSRQPGRRIHICRQSARRGKMVQARIAAGRLARLAQDKEHYSVYGPGPDIHKHERLFIGKVLLRNV